MKPVRKIEIAYSLNICDKKNISDDDILAYVIKDITDNLSADLRCGKSQGRMHFRTLPTEEIDLSKEYDMSQTTIIVKRWQEGGEKNEQQTKRKERRETIKDLGAEVK